MNIHLVAADEALFTECREILNQVPEAWLASTLQKVDSDDEWCEADLHIWNFHPDFLLPKRIKQSPLRHIFLVDRKDLALFQERFGTAERNFLLKPVGPGTLAAYLVAAISSGAAKTLRADRDEILQCLIQTNLKLQEYDHQRNAFLGRALYDFRAPLTALSGYCALLLEEPLGPLNGNQNEVLRRMQNSAKRLSRMTSAMYELSAGRNSDRQPDLQPADFRECLQQTLCEITPFADEKSIAVTVDLEASAEGLYFEAGQIQQVLLNILDNACRFTARGGSIEIRGSRWFWERRKALGCGVMGTERRSRTTREPNSYRVDIADAGAPIPEEHLERIFEECASYTGGCDRSGGGLGLAICKRIMRQHHGHIWAENHETGPVFSFVLPLHNSDPRFPITGGLAGAGRNLQGRRDGN